MRINSVFKKLVLCDAKKNRLMEGENQEKIFQPINIREVVKGKNPKLARRVPGFIYNWLEY